MEMILAEPAQNDIRAALAPSLDLFGEAIFERYQELIERALSDLQDTPTPPGSRGLPDLSPNHYTYHIHFARAGQAGDRVAAPRHMLVYRVETARIVVLRVLHERQVIPRTVDDADDDSANGR